MRYNMMAAAALVLTLTPALAMAQGAGRPITARTVPAKVCDMSARAITVDIVDAVSGAAVTEGTVTVKHVASEKKLGEATHFPARLGAWIVLQDGDLEVKDPKGERVMLEISRAGRAVVRREIRVGLDSTGCHLQVMGDLTPIKA